MTTTISLVSDKGGVGKTAAAILLAGEYALQGKRVLILDADSTRRIARWYEVCVAANNEPDNIAIDVATSANEIADALKRAKDRHDIFVIDAPGKVTIAHDEIITLSDIVLTPVQPGRDEMDALATAVESVAAVSDRTGREIPHAAFMSAIKLQDKSLVAYKTMHNFVQGLKTAGYSIEMLPTELTYRNIYREIRNGLGTLQMQAVTSTVLKARVEVANFAAAVEAAIARGKGEE